ncbi:MAG: xanthine dehydrogenase family protein molybdopterin-binding subunit [Elusimicrobiota bacterium]|jgi:CO/xanthine dehydrogenase Mo-binding subunit
MANVGSNVHRKDALEKLTGRALFIADQDIPGALFGVTVRSSIPRGRVRAVRFDPSFPWKEFVAASAKDIPGKNAVACIELDQPLLADGEIRHCMEPILLIAHERRERAYEALGHIEIEYEELPPVLDIEESAAMKAVVRAPDNIFKEFLIEKGELDAGFAQAAHVVEGEYRVPHQEQAYIEPNGAAAWFEKDGTLTVVGSVQCPYYVQKALKAAFDLPAEKVRVIQAVTGGAFGGKEDYPSVLAGHAALLALKARKPVRMLYDRAEDMASTTKRHPAIVRHRTGVDKEGRLLAQDIEVLMDGGAYLTLTSVVLSRGAIHAAGPYSCPNVRIRAKAFATNTPPNGAFRGFGAPQTLFAAELQMERIAEVLGMDPVEVRRRNAVVEGSVTATGQVLREGVAAREVLDLCAKRSDFARRRKAFDAWNKKAANPTWRGIGFALAYHGGGFTGGGEDYLASRAGVALDADGGVRVLAASTEMGQGAATIFSQMAADALGIPYEWVRVQTPDTFKVPDSGPTVASRTTMVVGRLVERAARELRAELEKSGSLPLISGGGARSGGKAVSRAKWNAAARKLLAGKPSREFITQYQRPPGIQWDDKTYKGDAYGTFAYAALAVELEVDKRTCEVRVLKVVTAEEIGRVIHPLLAEGQVIGGTAQGLGYALMENAVYRNGVMRNPHFTDYIIPTAVDVPPMEVLFIEKPYAYGGFGAKGVGELPMDVPAPAVCAALRQACGCWFTRLPVLPERIFAALPKKTGAVARRESLG